MVRSTSTSTSIARAARCTWRWCNNPKKQAGIEAHGLTVTALVPLEIPASDHSRRYLLTKKLKMGHLLASV